MTPLPASVPQSSPHPNGEPRQSLPAAGPPDSFFSVRPNYDGSNWPQGCDCEHLYGCGI